MCSVRAGRSALVALLATLVTALSAAAQDTDADGILDAEDNCLTTANPSQYDADIDGYGNACDADVNNDGIVGIPDNTRFQNAFGSFRGDPDFDPTIDFNGDDGVGIPDYTIMVNAFGNPPGPTGVACAGTVGCASCPLSATADADADGVADTLDNCVDVANTAQVDPGGDGFGLVCDGDLNDDGIARGTSDEKLWNSAFGTTAQDPGYLADADYSSATQGVGFPDGTISTPDLTVYVNFPQVSDVGLSGLVCPAFETLPSPVDARIQVVEGLTFFGSLLEPAPDPSEGLIFAVVDRPDYGNLVITDERTGAFRYDAIGSSDHDSFTWLIGTGFSSTAEATVEIEIWDPAGGSFVADEFSDDVLVVYNLNSPNADAQAIAEHYQTERNVPSANLCPVEMPPGLYATKDQFMYLREQVVDCMCDIVGTIPGCGLGTLDELREVAPISHLALMRGLPARAYDTPWIDDHGEYVFDPFLAYLVYHEEGDIFDPGQKGDVPDNSVRGHCELGADCRHPRDVDPARDDLVSFGRIEAMNRARTISLIDRTIDAEARGFRGALVSGPLHNFHENQRRTASFADECTSYLSHEPFVWEDPDSSWPFDECRAGSVASESSGSLSNRFPGREGTTIPVARGVGLAIIGSAPGDEQSGWYNFEALKRWEIADCQGAPLCDPQDSTCVSTDYFQELDTRCVGVADGFIGYRNNSWTVRGYGFFPTGWGGDASGATESTFPIVESSGGLGIDARYLHYGSYSVSTPDTSSCDGTPCPERLFVTLRTTVSNPPVARDGRIVAVRFQKRHPANAVGAAIAISLVVDGTIILDGTAPLEADTPTWTAAPDVLLQLPDDGGAPVQSLTLILTLDRSMTPIHRFLDLDAVEIVDVSTSPEVPLLPAFRGQFARTDHPQTNPGDYAATAIDRLGGIGWWGLSSHVGNGAGTLDLLVPRAFFSGKTLGETLALTTDDPKLLAYVDPLYRSSAAQLFIPGVPKIHGMLDEYTTTTPISALEATPSGPPVGASREDLFSRIWVDAMHGMANLQTVNWEVSACRSFDVSACDSGAAWVTGPLQTGNKKGFAYDWTPLIDTETDGPVTLRLRVWNVGEEDHALYDFAFFDWQVNSLP